MRKGTRTRTVVSNLEKLDDKQGCKKEGGALLSPEQQQRQAENRLVERGHEGVQEIWSPACPMVLQAGLSEEANCRLQAAQAAGCLDCGLCSSRQSAAEAGPKARPAGRRQPRGCGCRQWQLASGDAAKRRVAAAAAIRAARRAGRGAGGRCQQAAVQTCHSLLGKLPGHAVAVLGRFRCVAAKLVSALPLLALVVLGGDGTGGCRAA